MSHNVVLFLDAERLMQELVQVLRTQLLGIVCSRLIAYTRLGRIPSASIVGRNDPIPCFGKQRYGASELIRGLWEAVYEEDDGWMDG